MKKLFTLLSILASSLFNLCSAQVATTATATSNVTCNGGNEGSATSSTTAGTTPYTYSWTPSGGTLATATGLSAGTYTLTVTDASSNSATTTVVIGQPALIDVTPTFTNIACHGGTGSATAVATGGAAPFSDLFDFNGTADGSYPPGSLIRSGNSTTFYGVASSGGLNGDGCIFSYNTSTNIYTDLYNFDGITGANPAASLILSGTTLYGTANSGGASTEGCIFSFDTVGSAYTDLYNFSSANTNNAGENPTGSLILVGTTLYGTAGDGVNGDGCLFSYDTFTSTYTDIFDFDYTNGAYPKGALTYPGTGTTLYGLASGGGTHSDGCLFSFNTSGSVYTDLLDFDGTTNGQGPQGSLTYPETGTTFYGMTSGGGAHSDGCVFSFNTSGNVYTNLLNFNGTNGANPAGDVILSGTTLYGMTSGGGAHSDGCVFSFNLTGSVYTDMLDFNSTNGKDPVGDLNLLGPTLYGMAQEGGAHSDGLIFSVNPPYSYHWTPSGGTNLIATGLSVGTYTVTVTDVNSCSGSASVTISQPSALSNGATVLSSNLCNGTSYGNAMASPSGGTSPYTYSWSDGSTSNPTGTNLSAGTYTITVTDNNGCTATAKATITEPSAIFVARYSAADTGSNTGIAAVTVSGGTAPYTYSWAGGQTTDTIIGQDTGTYCCVITDNNGCTNSACITLTTTGINTIASSSNQISIYPNPNNGNLIVSCHSASNAGAQTMEVYNMLGEQIYSANLKQQADNSINLSNQPNGVYLYRVITETGNFVGEGRFVIEK